MKKIFTLIVALVATVFSANAEEIVLYEGKDAISWDKIDINVSGITENSGLTLHVTIETTSGDWWQFKFAQTSITDWPGIPVNNEEFIKADKVSYSWAAGTYTYDFELTDEQIAMFKAGVGVQGQINNNGDLNPAPQIFLKKVTVESKVNYQEAVDLTEHMDENGNILSKYFNGFSDDAVVEFTWNSTNTSGAIGWGAGSLKSMDGTVDTNEKFNIKNEGANVVKKKLKDLKEALDAGPDQYNRYGIIWSIWGTGGSSNERVSVKIYEVEGFDGEGYLSPDSKPVDLDHIDGYKDPVEISMNEWGSIESKAFNGFSEYAIVMFVWESENGDNVKGWGAGRIESFSEAVKLDEPFNVQGSGKNFVKMELKDLIPALNADPKENGNYGINWVMWGFDDKNCTNTRLSVKVFEIEGFQGDGYAAPDANSIQNVSTESAKAVKAINNGRIVISNNGNEYNVAGQLTK